MLLVSGSVLSVVWWVSDNFKVYLFFLIWNICCHLFLEEFGLWQSSSSLSTSWLDLFVFCCLVFLLRWCLFHAVRRPSAGSDTHNIHRPIHAFIWLFGILPQTNGWGKKRAHTHVHTRRQTYTHIPLFRFLYHRIPGDQGKTEVCGAKNHETQ